MVNDKTYVAGLKEFLGSSEEDMVDIDGIISQFPYYANGLIDNLRARIGLLRRRKVVNVLDVGSGNGKKALYLAKKFEGMGIKSIVSSIEPRAEQIKELVQTYQGDNRKYLDDVYPQTFDEFVPQKEYDIILFIHSLYEFPRDEDGTIATLGKLPDCLKFDGVGIIIVEHGGHFQMMKHELYPVFGKVEPVNPELVEKTLIREGVLYKRGDKIDFRFYLDDLLQKSDLEVGRSLEFLFSDSLEAEGLTDGQCRLVGKWVRKNRWECDGRQYLWTPDIVFWVKTK